LERACIQAKHACWSLVNNSKHYKRNALILFSIWLDLVRNNYIFSS
jgi:hypothetical protein